MLFRKVDDFQYFLFLQLFSRLPCQNEEQHFQYGLAMETDKKLRNIIQITDVIYCMNSSVGIPYPIHASIMI